MQRDTSLYTPAEAAVLSRLSLKAVNNAIDKKTIVARRRGGARVLDEAALVYLALEKDLARDTTRAFRRRVFAEISSAPRRNLIAVGALQLDLRGARRAIRERIGELRRANRLVVIDPGIMGGQPVFRGTRVPVHVIADQIAWGETREQLRRSYPRVTDEMIRIAPIYAEAHPARGRPRRQPWHDRPPILEIRIPISDLQTS